MYSSIFLRFEQRWLPTGRCDKIVSDISFQFFGYTYFMQSSNLEYYYLKLFLHLKILTRVFLFTDSFPKVFYMKSLASLIVHIPFTFFTVYSLVFDHFYFSRLYQLTSLILTHQLAYHFLTHNVLCGHP